MGSNIVKVVTVMGLLGIPTIFTMTISCIRSCRKYAKHLAILMKSQQAQMRSNLLDKYHFYMEQGFITEDELEDWENQYQSYHELGKNGVLDARREQLFKLPNETKGEM